MRSSAKKNDNTTTMIMIAGALGLGYYLYTQSQKEKEEETSYSTNGNGDDKSGSNGENSSNGQSGSNGKSGSDGSITLYNWSVLDSNTKLKHIDMTTDDRIEGVKTDDYGGAFFLKNNTWVTYGGYNHKIKSNSGFYDTHHKDVVVYTTLTNNKIHRYIKGWRLNDLGSSWLTVISTGGGAQHITGGSHIVGIGGGDKLYRYDGSGRWSHAYGGDNNFSFVNAAKSPNVCGVKKDGTIYKSDTNKMVKISNNSIKFKKCSIGDDESIFAVDDGNNLYKLGSDNEWTLLNKKAKMVAHNNEGVIYIININDNIEKGVEI